MKKSPYLLPAVVALTLLPVLLLGITEAVLRISGSGLVWSLTHTVPGDVGLLTDNLDYHKKFYPSEGSAPVEETRPNLFLEKKEPGVLRGFVLGESTPQGFPFSMNQGFIKMTEAGINQAAGKKRVELINFSRTAMNSYYVRDAAAEVLKMDPDFLVIYVGHNEYYGNMGAASGGNHFTRGVTLALKNLYSYQALTSLGSPDETSETLMAEKFASTLVNSDSIEEANLASAYLDNLQTAVAPYLDRKIPVFIFVPASNMGSLPPFAGKDQAKHSVLLSKIAQARLKDINTLVALETEVEAALKETPDQAQLLWTFALIQSLKSGKFDKDGFTKAVDEDLAPFRMRSSLAVALKNWSKGYEGLHLIDLPKELESRFGEMWSTDQLFLDHVHLNKVGQAGTAAVLASHLSQVLPLDISGPSLAALFNVPEKLWLTVGLNPISEGRAYLSLVRLFSAPPYSTMLIPYSNPTVPYFTGDPLWADDSVKAAISSSDLTGLTQAILNFYEKNADFSSILMYLQTEVFLNPGLSTPYANLLIAALGTEVSDGELITLAKKVQQLSLAPESDLSQLADAAAKRSRESLASEIRKLSVK